MFLLVEAEKGREDLSRLIDCYLQSHPLDRKEGALLTELVYGVFRQRTFLDWQIDHASKVPQIHTPIRHILRLGLYQLLFLNKIPSFAAVDTSVNLSKEAGGISAARLVNGLLRTILRQKAQLPMPDPHKRAVFISVQYSHPLWIVGRWLKRWGKERTISVCRSNNEAPPVTLRVNTLKTDPARLSVEIEKCGGESRPARLSPSGLHMRGVSVRSLPSYHRGEFYIQDEAGQLIGNLVDPRPGEAVLDLCAAPGGKTTHLAELMQGKGHVHASDIDPERVAMMKENLKRLQTPGVSIETLEEVLASDRRYDRILVDAPCSALGILRRIPEGKWRKEPEIIQTYAKVQRALLERAVDHLKPGARLIYATCSTEPEENEAVVESFSKRHPDLKIENPSGSLPHAARRYLNEKGYFTTCFNSDRMDRFFAVRWVKRY